MVAGAFEPEMVTLPSGDIVVVILPSIAVTNRWISLVRGYCWVCFSGFPRECFISCYRNSSVCLRVLYSSRYTSRVKSIFGQTRAVDSLIRAVNENRQHQRDEPLKLN